MIFFCHLVKSLYRFPCIWSHPAVSRRYYAEETDVYPVVASLITAILIIRSQRPRNRKIAALVFITLPVLNYVMALGTFGNASQYGMVLMSLIIMYCNIFYILHDTSSAVNRRRLSEVRELRFIMAPGNRTSSDKEMVNMV